MKMALNMKVAWYLSFLAQQFLVNMYSFFLAKSVVIMYSTLSSYCERYSVMVAVWKNIIWIRGTFSSC